MVTYYFTNKLLVDSSLFNEHWTIKIEKTYSSCDCQFCKKIKLYMGLSIKDVRIQGEGSSADILRTMGSQFFSRLCADALYGRPLMALFDVYKRYILDNLRNQEYSQVNVTLLLFPNAHLM